MRSYEIPKKVVLEAFKKVKENRGAEGIDEVSLKEFEADLDNNLYKIWNRMTSGSYFPPPVKAIEIEKKSGGKRVLGIPTVGDRVAQMVAKIYLNPLVEPHFHKDSYGYREGKSAIDALEVTRQRCWQYDWVLEFDKELITEASETLARFLCNLIDCLDPSLLIIGGSLWKNRYYFDRILETIEENHYRIPGKKVKVELSSIEPNPNILGILSLSRTTYKD